MKLIFVVVARCNWNQAVNDAILKPVAYVQKEIIFDELFLWGYAPVWKFSESLKWTWDGYMPKENYCEFLRLCAKWELNFNRLCARQSDVKCEVYVTNDDGSLWIRYLWYYATCLLVENFYFYAWLHCTVLSFKSVEMYLRIVLFMRKYTRLAVCSNELNAL